MKYLVRRHNIYKNLIVYIQHRKRVIVKHTLDVSEKVKQN
jgi:hypothetical protein